jgi:hypothetical protein
MNGMLQREMSNNTERMKTKEKGCYFHIKLLEASVGKKTAPRALIKAYKKFILIIGDSRMNHF